MTVEKIKEFRAINWKKSNIVAVSGSVRQCQHYIVSWLNEPLHGATCSDASHLTPHSLRVTIMDILTNHLQPSRLIRVQSSQWTSKYFPEMNI